MIWSASWMTNGQAHRRRDRSLPGLLFGLHAFSQESRIRGLRLRPVPIERRSPSQKGRWGQGGSGVGAVLPEAVSISAFSLPQVYVVSRETAWMREAARSPGGRWGRTPRSPRSGSLTWDVGNTWESLF